MDCVSYPIHQSHMYRQDEFQQQQEKHQHQQKQQQQFRKPQPQQYPHKTTRGEQYLLSKQLLFHPHQQISGRNRSGRGGRHRVVISPVLSDSDRYDFYPEGSVNVRGDWQADNNDNNNNSSNKIDKAVASEQHQTPDNGTTADPVTKNVNSKSGVQTPKLPGYDNILTAVPRLSRVLEEEGVSMGGGDIFVGEHRGNRAHGDKGIGTMVEQEAGKKDARGLEKGKERAIDRREETICIVPSPHTLSAAARLSGAAREPSRWGGERLVASTDTTEMGGGSGGGDDGGEQCPRTGLECSVSTDGCTARSTPSSHQGKLCVGYGGGDGGDCSSYNRGEDGVTATCHLLNNAGGQRSGEKPLITDSAVSGAKFRNHRQQSADEDDVTSPGNGKAVCVDGTTALNTSPRSDDFYNSAIKHISHTTSQCFSSESHRINTAEHGEHSKSEVNGNSDDTAETCSEQPSYVIKRGSPEMGNQSSSSKVSNSGSDSRLRKISFRDKKVQSPSLTVDASVHFKKDNATSIDSDGGSISIVSETKQSETFALTPVNKSVEETTVVADDEGSYTEILNDLNRETSKPKDFNYETNHQLPQSSDFDDYTNIAPIVEETVKKDVKEPTLNSESGTIQVSSIEQGENTPISSESIETSSDSHVEPLPSTLGTESTTTSPVERAAAVTELGAFVRSVKLGPKTEDIYALPVPRKMRTSTRPGLERQEETEEEEEEAQSAEPPPVPERLHEAREPISEEELNAKQPTPNNSGKQENAGEPEVKLRHHNTVQVTCQMKKSHTTCGGLSRAASSRDSGDYHSYRGYYYNSGTTGPSYDYFSLGRKPKRQPRVKTLTDSQGMAMSLDKLLKLRRQGTSTPSSSLAQLSQEPSVEDILRSCSEYDMTVPSEPAYRDRTSSDADATRSPLDRPAYPRGPLLSFTEASQIKIPDDWKGFGNLLNDGKRRGSAKAFARASKNSKRSRASAREAKSKPVSGATVQKSDSVRSAPPAPEDRHCQGEIRPLHTDEYVATYTKINALSASGQAGETVLKKTETELNQASAIRQEQKPTSSSLASHSGSSANHPADNKTNIEPSCSKAKDHNTDSIRLREPSSKEHVREASFTSSWSSHSSSTSTVTVVACDQLSSTLKPHSNSSATSSSVQDSPQPDTASVHSCSNANSLNKECTTSSDKPGSVTTNPAATVQTVNVGKLGPAILSVKPSTGEESEARNGRNLSSPPDPIIVTPSSGKPDVPNKLHKISSDENSKSRQKPSSISRAQKSLSADSTSSINSNVSNSNLKKRKMETGDTKHVTKQKEVKAPDKKSYSLRWLKSSSSSDKSSKSKSSSKNPPLKVKATHEEPQVHLSTTSEPDSRSSSLTTSGSFTSDPRSPLTSGGSLDDSKSPVFSPMPEMSTLTVDTSTPSGFFSKERISPSFAAPKSPNHRSKLEAYEALKWLRAAGFPQYAQMFEDGQFPLELSFVEKDHDFLDPDSLQSLFRRLETLNKYAGMKLEGHPRKKTASEEEDEEDFCALSERWEYQKSVRRWSRKDLQPPCSPTSPTSAEVKGDGRGFTYTSSEPGKQKGQVSQRAPSHDSLLADQDDSTQCVGSDQTDSGVSVHPQPKQEDSNTQQLYNEGEEDTPSERHTSSSSSASSTLSPRLRRAASERIKTAKSLWRKMEGGLKARKSRRHHAGSSSNRNGSGGALQISDPVLADKAGDMQARLERLHCVDIKQRSSGHSGTTSPSDSLSSRLGPALSEEPASSKPSQTESKSAVHTSSSTTSSSTHSDPSSPAALPDPAFRSRPVDSTSSSTSNQSHPHPSPDTQKPSSSGASLSEYYSAQSQFQQNLRQAQQKTSGGLGNLMEIFLLPQDHQPGRFPTALQNGYIEKDPVLSPTSAGANGGSNATSGNFISFPANTPGSGKSKNAVFAGSRGANANRASVYDNFGLPSSKTPDNRILNSTIDESSKKQPPASRSARAMSADNAGQASPETLPNSKDRSVSFDAASERNLDSSESAASIRNRSVSFESSSVLAGKEKDESVFGASNNSSISSSRTEAYVDSLPGKGMAHSASADSYFRDTAQAPSTSDTGSVSSATSHDDGSSTCSSSNTLQYSNYEEFEAILKQLYENISDLTSVIDWDDDDKTSQPSDTKAVTSTSATTELRVETPSLLSSSGRRLRPQPGPDPNIDLDLEELDSPSSPTSDPLALSPTASRGEGATDESLDLDQENSSSSSAGDGGSHTADSGSDDAEALIADLSHDDSLDTIPAVTRERRDSGVGHSLTRAPSDRRRKKIRWHSFQRSHRPDVTCRAHQVNALTVGQLVRLQKLALLKLTGIMEKCLPVNKSGWNWMMPRFMKRHKAPDFSDRAVFGVPLSVMVQRSGQPLPQCVLYAMRYLRRTSQTSIGIFRKSGVKSKIQQLRDHLEAHPDTTDFEGMNTYNVADMLKTFFRDLPECLLTSKMSETFRSIYTHVPQSQRLEAMQAAILLLPDENREVLQSILLFLSDISSHQADHQMNASNLAVCFTPTVFQLGRSGSGSPASPKRGRKLGSGNSSSPGTPDPREIMEQKAAHECLHMLISECKNLFTVPAHLFRQLQVISLAHEEPGPLHDLGTSTEEVRAFGQERIQLVLKEAHDRKSHWHFMHSAGDVEVYNRKPVDDYPLKEWKLIVDIEAPPIEVLRRIMHERHAWDEDLLSWSVVERLDPHSDIFQYALNTMAPHPSRHYCVLRYWRSDLTKGSCALVTMSVEHADIGSIQGVWAIDLGSYFLMEPCGAGRSRLTYITRVDTRGRTPEWYTKMYGHIQANFLERLKDSFKQDTSGPETKV